MFKKFLLSLVFVGSIGTQSDAMQEDLLNAPLEMKNVGNFHYMIQADEIVAKMEGFDYSEPENIVSFIETTFEKYNMLKLTQKNAFAIYVAFLASNEFGELDSSVISTARTVWNKIKETFH